MMDDEELLQKTLYVAREVSMLQLHKRGAVLPFGVTLDLAGDNPKTYYPRDELPRAAWDELLEATRRHLQQCGRARDVGALAFATTLESDSGASGLGIQVETRSASLFLVYPYSQSGEDWILGEPQSADQLLLGPLLHTAKR